MRATFKCPHCSKVAEVIKEKPLPKLHRIVYTLKCGHTTFEKLQIHEIPESRDEMWPLFFGYQQKGIEFLERANFKALIADEMALGKTIQALGALRYNYDTLSPSLFVVKASLIPNWIKEYVKWVLKDNKALEGRYDVMPIPVMDGQTSPMPGFKCYILSMDLLNKPKIKQWILETGFKTVVIDESHHFKNVNSKRTTAINEVTGNVLNRICLSGTPFLNNSLEYWPTLNFIHPEHFPSRKRFTDRFIDYDYETKRFLGLKKYARDDFFRLTEKYVIRREKKDVLKDLPPLRSTSQTISTFDRAFANAYNRELDKLDGMLDAVKGDYAMRASFMAILAQMSKMRHITGLAKVQAAFEYAEEFLASTDKNSKLCIGIHHKDVAEWLRTLLTKYEPVMISGADSPVQKQEKEDEFRTSKRLAICNILAVGEGRNFQFCPNALVLERQWNRAKEAQFEGRFQRPIKCPKCDTPFIKVSPQDNIPYYLCSKCGETSAIIPVQIDYLLAAGTIDEFFAKLVELKGKVCDSTLSWEFDTDYHAIYQLAREVINARMRAGV
jgi:superfamily II DNA or RNA helicase/Zn ribbon nucleic-acid-binding protein